ncbi:MAG: hypothetical protein IPK57_19645 [Chitinophagaceae bacterium]|nr:hypothetical protein [Chitinophagaceae bacterium]
MKTFKYIISALSFSCIMIGTATAQNQPGVDSTGLPGDDFSLQGALQMFQDATTIEDFEKLLIQKGIMLTTLT